MNNGCCFERSDVLSGGKWNNFFSNRRYRENKLEDLRCKVYSVDWINFQLLIIYLKFKLLIKGLGQNDWN